MTIIEKIIAAHCGKDWVEPGQFTSVRVDMALSNDVTAPIAIREFKKLGVDKVFDKDKVVMVADHFTPNKDIASAEQARQVRQFALRQGIHHYDVGTMGIEHVLLPEQGLVLPGEVVIGADSHTCTYGALGAFATGMGSTDIASAMATGEIWMKVPPSIKFVYRGQMGKWLEGKDLILHTIGDIGVDGALYAAMEFTGEAIADLSMDGRFTISNMAIEAGAKAGICHVDDKTLAYIKNRAKRDYKVYKADEDAAYSHVVEYDVTKIEPQVALPHLPSNTRAIGEVEEIELDQVVIGSCTNGRIEDMRKAAWILKGRRIHPRVRCIVIPGTQAVSLQMIREGLMTDFIAAGCVVSTSTCGPCLGGHMGILAAGERCLATTNRNFVGRMGSPESEVYLAGAVVAAASALAGKITSPDSI